MKKVILSVAAVFAFGFANAQDTKVESTGEGFASGDIFVSGSVGFNSQETGDDKVTGFNFSPKVGYFVSENIAVGVALGVSNVKDEDAFGDAKNSNLAVGAFARYYATPASKFSVFGQFSANYNSYDNEFGPMTGEGTGFDAGLGLGLNYFVSNNFAIEATFGALRYATSEPDETTANPNPESTDTFGLDFNLSSINLGLVYKF